MHNSFLQYLEKPVVQQKSSIKNDDIQKPYFYVCQNDQFDYTRSKEIGYDDLVSLALGSLNDESAKYSWKGKNENWTFKELQDLLFEHDYTEFWAGQNLLNKTWTSATYNMFYLPAYGFCMKIHQIKGYYINFNFKKTSFL